MDLGIENRDTVSIEPWAPFPPVRESDTRRCAADTCQDATAKQPLQIDGEIEPLCAQRLTFPDPTSHRHVNRPNLVDPFYPFDKLSPLALHQPCEVHLWPMLLDRRHHWKCMDNISKRTRLDQKNTGSIPEYGGRGAERFDR